MFAIARHRPCDGRDDIRVLAATRQRQEVPLETVSFARGRDASKGRHNPAAKWTNHADATGQEERGRVDALGLGCSEGIRFVIAPTPQPFQDCADFRRSHPQIGPTLANDINAFAPQDRPEHKGPCHNLGAGDTVDITNGSRCGDELIPGPVVARSLDTCRSQQIQIDVEAECREILGHPPQRPPPGLLAIPAEGIHGRLIKVCEIKPPLLGRHGFNIGELSFTDVHGQAGVVHVENVRRIASSHHGLQLREELTRITRVDPLHTNAGMDLLKRPE